MSGAERLASDAAPCASAGCQRRPDVSASEVCCSRRVAYAIGATSARQGGTVSAKRPWADVVHDLVRADFVFRPPEAELLGPFHRLHPLAAKGNEAGRA